MAAFPDVILPAPYVAQTEYKSDVVDVLQIEDDVIGQAADFRQVLRLVGGAIGRDFAVVEFAGKPRFPQARCADPV